MDDNMDGSLNKGKKEEKGDTGGRGRVKKNKTDLRITSMSEDMIKLLDEYVKENCLPTRNAAAAVLLAGALRRWDTSDG